MYTIHTSSQKTRHQKLSSYWVMNSLGDKICPPVIYPVELEIKDTTDADHHASYLDLLLKYDNFHRFQVKLYKRGDVNFDIINFPFLCSNIPQSPAYGVFVSSLIRYARAYSMYTDFIMRSQPLLT